MLKKVAIDFGHQATGQDTAAPNEYSIIRAYAPYVVSGFGRLGYEVVNVTPPEASRTLSDSLSYRTSAANRASADLFISCHANSSTPSGQGYEVVYGSTTGANYAQCVAAKLNALGFQPHRGGYYQDDRGLAVIKRTNMPAIIVEPLFASSSEDIALFNQIGPERVGYAIVEGITGRKVLGNNPKYYVVTNYIPEGIDGVELNAFWYKYMTGVNIARWYAKSNAKGLWFQTQYMSKADAETLAARLQKDGYLYQLVIE